MTTKAELSVFAAGARDLFEIEGKRIKATNKVIESWSPVIRAAMDAAGVESSDVEAKFARQVRGIFYEFMTEFFEGCPKAMEILQAQASLKCVGFEKLGGSDHLQAIIKEVKWPNLGGQILYVYKTLNALFNELGYKEVIRDNKKGKKPKDDAETPEVPAPAAAPAPEAPEVGENELLVALPKGLENIPEAILGLLEAYGVEPGDDGANWLEMLRTTEEMVRQLAATKPEPVAA